jgi:MFS family permease
MNSRTSLKDSLRALWQVLSYGHYVVPACFAVMFLLYGAILNTFTVFVDPLVEALDTTRGKISIAMMIGAFGMGAAAPVAGILMDRIGVKRIMIAGTLMIGFGILIASRVTALWQMYIIYAFVGIGLASATVIACSLIVSNWFVSRRGTAMGIMAMGTSTGGMAMTPVANWIIQHHGWRTAYVFSGTTILLVGLPIIIFLLRCRPSDAAMEPFVDPTLPPDDVDISWGLSAKEAFSAKAFWQIAALMFIIGLVTSGLGIHVVPCIKDFGHSPDNSALVWTITLFVMTISKFLFGPIADRWGEKQAMAFACALMAASILFLSLATRYEIALLFGILYGFGVGAPLTVNPLLVTRALGLRHFGALYGILNLISIIGAAFGPVILGLVVYDNFESYLPGLYAFIVLMVVSAAIAYFVSYAARENQAAIQAQTADAVE